MGTDLGASHACAVAVAVAAGGTDVEAKSVAALISLQCVLRLGIVSRRGGGGRWRGAARRCVLGAPVLRWRGLR